MEQEPAKTQNQLKFIQSFCRLVTENLLETEQESKVRGFCEQLKSMCGAQDVLLFVKKAASNQYEFRNGAGDQSNQYLHGMLKIEEEEIGSAYASNLQTASQRPIEVRTPKETFDLSSTYSMLLPLVRAQNTIGLLICLHDKAFSSDQIEYRDLVAFLVAQIGAETENHNKIMRLSEKAKSLSLLYEIGSRLSNIRDEEKLLDSIMDLVEKYILVDRCSLMIIDEDQKYLRIKRAFGMPEVDTDAVKVVLGEGISGYVATGTKPLLIKDISAESHLLGQIENRDTYRTNSLLSIPLVTQGKTIGVINVNNKKDGTPFSEEDKDLLVKIGSEIAAVLQRSYMALQIKKARDLEADIKRSMA